MTKNYSRSILLAVIIVLFFGGIARGVEWNPLANGGTVINTAGPTKSKFQKTFQSPQHTCPTTDSKYPNITGEIPVSWETISGKIDTTQIQFQGWASPRRLIRQKLIAGHYQLEHIYVGPEGKDILEAVKSNVYAGARPFEALDDDVDFLFGLKWHDQWGLFAHRRAYLL